MNQNATHQHSPKVGAKRILKRKHLTGCEQHKVEIQQDEQLLNIVAAKRASSKKMKNDLVFKAGNAAPHNPKYCVNCKMGQHEPKWWH